jgi:hypothetical protein
MSTTFTLAFLQDKIGEQYVEANPVTNQPRIIQGLNEVWRAIDEQGGVGQIAKVFGLSEVDVWAWVDGHEVPGLYAPYLAPDGNLADLQLSSVGYWDVETGACWPNTWKLERDDVNLFSKAFRCGPVATKT